MILVFEVINCIKKFKIQHISLIIANDTQG